MYNLCFGVNRMAPLLLKVLGINQDDGRWPAGRFRDIYLNEDGTRILLYTRNGGGNRDCFEEGDDDCRCTGCVITRILPQHPHYVRDYDDDFDCTYATIEFRVPPEYEAEMRALATGKSPPSVGEKFQALVEVLEKGGRK